MDITITGTGELRVQVSISANEMGAAQKVKQQYTAEAMRSAEARGREEGEEYGRLSQAAETAKVLRQSGHSVEEAARLNGLSLADIEALEGED